MADRGPKTGRMPLAQAGLYVATALFVGIVGGVNGWLALTGDAGPAMAHAEAGNETAHDNGHAANDGHGAGPKADGDHATTAHESDEHKPDTHAAGAKAEGQSDEHGKPAHADGGHAAEGHATAKQDDPAHAEPAHAADQHSGDHGKEGAAPTAHGDTAHQNPADGHNTAEHDSAPAHGTDTSHDARDSQGDQRLAMAPAARARTPKPPPALATADRQPLVPAPDPAISTNGRYGPLPIRSSDGRLPWKVYSRPFDADIGIPRIAIIVTNMGLAEQPTLAAIQDLPGEVTLAFSPYSSRLAEWVPAARAAGHEVLLQLPMEPRSTEFNDPGNKALLTDNTPEVNQDRMEWVMSRAEGYVGLTNMMGSRFTVSPKDMQPVLVGMDQRGLLYVDSRESPASIAGKLAAEMGIPSATNDRFIDAEAARGPIDTRLAQLEQLALARGSAVGFAADYPVAIERLRHWIDGLASRGFVLAPVSAVVRSTPPE